MKLQILYLLLLATTSVLGYNYASYSSSMTYSTDFSGTAVTMGFTTLNDTHFKCLLNISTPAPAADTANMVLLLVAINPTSMTPGKNSWVGADFFGAMMPVANMNGTSFAQAMIVDGYIIAETNSSKDPAVGRIVAEDDLNNRWTLINGSNATSFSGNKAIYTAEYSSPYAGVQGQDYTFNKDKPLIKGNMIANVTINITDISGESPDANNSTSLNFSYSDIKQFTLSQNSGSTSNILKNAMAMIVFFAGFLVLVS